ncbi:TatD family hydrolase, partial [Campylobacter fetus subsp. venerealis]
MYSTKFDPDRDQVIRDIREAGIERLYMPNVDVESIEAMLACEEKYPDLCIAMMGLHPCDVKDDYPKQLAVMEEWLNKRPFAAIGE